MLNKKILLILFKNYVTSTKNIPRLSSKERKNIKLSQNSGEVLTGIKLSDGHIAQRSSTSNCRFVFNQSGKTAKKEYFEYVFNIFKPYCTINLIMKI